MKDRVEIFKNGVWVELVLKQQKIKYNALSNKISSIESRRINHSNTFSIPYVSENIIALDINVFSPTLMAQSLNKKYVARYFIKDKLAQKGFIVINNTLRGDININFVDEALVITDEWGKITYKQLLRGLGEDITLFPKQILCPSIKNVINVLKNYETDKTKQVLGTPPSTFIGDDPSIDSKSIYIARYPNPLNNIGDKFNVDSTGIRKIDSFNPFQSRPIFSLIGFLYIICQAYGYTLKLDPGVDFNLLRDTYLVNKGEDGGGPANNSTLPSQTTIIPSADANYYNLYTRGPGNNDNEGFFEHFFIYPDDTPTIDQFGKKVGVASKKPSEVFGYSPSHFRGKTKVNILTQNCIVQIEDNPYLGEVIWTAKISRRAPDNRFQFRRYAVKSVWLNNLGRGIEADFITTIESDETGERRFTITGNKEQLNNTPPGAVTFVGLICRIEVLNEDQNYNDFTKILDMKFTEKVLPKGKASYDSYGQFLQNRTNLLDLAPDVSVKDLLSSILQQQGLLITFEKDSTGEQNIVKLFTYGAYRNRVQEARQGQTSNFSMWKLDNYISPNIYFTRNYGSDTSLTVQTSTDGINWINSTGGISSPRNIGSKPNGSFIRLQSTSDNSISNMIQVGQTNLLSNKTKFYDWSKYHQRLIPPLFNTDYGSDYGEINEISLSNPYPGNIGRIKIHTDITSRGFQTKLIPLAKNQAKGLNDVSAVNAILNTEPFFEYTLKEQGLVKCSFDQYLPGIRKQYNAELTVSNIDCSPLPLVSNVIYSDGFLPIGIKEWYLLVDESVRSQATFLLPILVLRNFDISLPVYIESLGGFYIVEGIEEYTDDVTLVKVNLIKLPL